MTVTPTGLPAVVGAVRWVHVPAGTCLYGDARKPRPVPALLVAETPLTVKQCGLGDTDLPVTGISYDDAVRLAAEAGGRLPTSLEWEWIAAGSSRRLYPWGDEPWTPDYALLTGAGQSPCAPQPVRRHPAGATPQGVLGLAGNVWEWTSSTAMGQGKIIRGGSYASPPLYAHTTFLNAVPVERRSSGISVRPVRIP
ncbi:formylglycine-generating enzyme family protein [Micromonospora humida]|uniref:SUMF1/EgtB/PvdO family nonheme iron enzyme n=1 Tax=Micromonospora humida TaxID=2809018 RepID=A0ABS2IQB0_9ACTN|nr:SUMF1/EgtB/PvdO family nonheme iron enzyme [Micromonospora humida]MBM7075513.1 SUMF1/EgtB/PvdO family nonheme iron enzyme [Micromonospora humida]